MTYTTPPGRLHAVYQDMTRQDHLLIGGATGSGKSVLLHALVYTLTYKAPSELHLALIDPKRVELRQYANLPHTISHVTEPPQIAHTLARLNHIMDSRYYRFQHGQFKTTEPHIYVIIDELADLMHTLPAIAESYITRLARLGRAAGIHLIVATQSPSRKVITAPIKANMTARLALRTEEAIESRQVINTRGAENLPLHGYGIYRTPHHRQPLLVNLPMIDPQLIQQRIAFWQSQTTPTK